MLCWLNSDQASPPRLDNLSDTDPGFGSIVVNCQFFLHILKEVYNNDNDIYNYKNNLSYIQYQIKAVSQGEALPLMSHSNLIIANLILLCKDIEKTLNIGVITTAFSFAGFLGNIDIFTNKENWENATIYESKFAENISKIMNSKRHKK
jgi:hypothetical protein